MAKHYASKRKQRTIKMKTIIVKELFSVKDILISFTTFTTFIFFLKINNINKRF